MSNEQNPIVAGIKDRIKEAREKQQLTQSALAKHLSISRTAITQWEAGLTFPSYEKTMEMAKLLYVRPEWIAFGVTTPVEYRVPTDSVKVDIVDFGTDANERRVVGTHYLSTEFVKDTLRATELDKLFIYHIESETFAPRFQPRDHLVVDGSVTKATGEGMYLIWNGLSAQVVNIQANYAEPGTVVVRTTDRAGEAGNTVEAAKLIVLGRIKGRIGAAL
ncbi:transcriptional regulator with XRE-family HTH domain [Rhizobium rosettiformans]|uniref:Helix-turn-helix transcriptional regulator n=2 Tax=Rhizobium rosettiformans TaxID=1368430 RepID=A0A4V4HR92_9HYPH|nr:helix-turn-helix transcriptional regulator [Rhizobium rosettiformans]MBB5276262.1 transcriptional regulator with XRE-family HTH domain [Rhizobium rosettiformans]THV36896.1 helix-turn-helix transcriptional regulator [Rhizobium rosettiformans W3]